MAGCQTVASGSPSSRRRFRASFSVWGFLLSDDPASVVMVVVVVVAAAAAGDSLSVLPRC